ncbi:delta-lactam-biosynthetic de-N-acetylase [Paenibacillus terrigena]|uniref:delta-lactam-biosynthetic de-N-acetylase n=1 Tax=Paenibacillus terrigena TaxID=369333 RepID=UPI000372EA2F
MILLFVMTAVPYTNQAAYASSTNPYHFGFKKSKNHQSASIQEEGFKDILMRQNSIFLGDVSKKELYLTFDNGYENGFTPKILDILKEHQVPAIFFVTGHYVKEEPDLIKRMVAEGHLVGNHSWSHPDMSQISNAKLREELDKVRIEVQRITNQQSMTYLRPPRGIFNERVLQASKELGYTSVFWSIAYKDWDTNAQRGWRYAYDSVMNQLHPGAVILLHSVSRDNTMALGAMLAEAKRQGYVFKCLDQLQMKNY